MQSCMEQPLADGGPTHETEREETVVANIHNNNGICGDIALFQELRYIALWYVDH